MGGLGPGGGRHDRGTSSAGSRGWCATARPTAGTAYLLNKGAMTPMDVLLIKCFGSYESEDVARRALHSAFEDPRSLRTSLGGASGSGVWSFTLSVRCNLLLINVGTVQYGTARYFVAASLVTREG